MSVLSVKNLVIKYKDGISDNIIIHDTNLSFEQGDNIILSGPSGCGKSSLLYVLALLRKPSEGIITYKDKAIKNRKQMETIRYNDFGFIFQHHYLITYLSVLENICIKGNTTKNAAIEILEKVGMENNGHKKIYQLSGGQKQRVAIARALVNNPTVIFADEPTASLDKENAIQIYKIIQEVSKDKILIMSTHDNSLLSGEETIYTFKNRKVIEVNIDYEKK